MRCTSCNEPILPVVAVDIDGTLGDYHGHFISFLEQYLGITRSEDNYDGVEQFRDWVCRTYGISLDKFRQIKLAYRQGGMKRSMPIDEDARRLCRAIQQAGAELWITTSRPYLRLDNIDPDTHFWLDRHDIKPDGIIYGDDKYAQLNRVVGAYRVVAVLDDLVDMIELSEELFGRKVPILRRTQYNDGVIVEQEVASLLEARILITDRIGMWYQQNGKSE